MLLNCNRVRSTSTYMHEGLCSVWVYTALSPSFTLVVKYKHTFFTVGQKERGKMRVLWKSRSGGNAVYMWVCLRGVAWRNKFGCKSRRPDWLWTPSSACERAQVWVFGFEVCRNALHHWPAFLLTQTISDPSLPAAKWEKERGTEKEQWRSVCVCVVSSKHAR